MSEKASEIVFTFLAKSKNPIQNLLTVLSIHCSHPISLLYCSSSGDTFSDKQIRRLGNKCQIVLIHTRKALAEVLDSECFSAPVQAFIDDF